LGDFCIFITNIKTMVLLIMIVSLYLVALHYISKDIYSNTQLYSYQKTIWMLLVIVAPLMGSFLYYLLGVRKK
jgi:hypothetical protein